MLSKGSTAIAPGPSTGAASEGICTGVARGAIAIGGDGDSVSLEAACLRNNDGRTMLSTVTMPARPESRLALLSIQLLMGER